MNHLEKAEFWILNRTVQTSLPIYMILEKEVGYHSMEGYHGLDDHALLQTLHHLFQSGDLVASTNEQEDEFIPSFEQVEDNIKNQANITPKDTLYLHLTPLGGARWERVVQPDWNRLANGWPAIWVENQNACGATDQGFWDKGVWEVVGTTRESTLGYLAAWQELAQQEFSGLGQEEALYDPASLEWEIMTPWEATNWKTLPIGYRCQFRPSLRAQEKSVPTPYWEWYELPMNVGSFPECPPVDWFRL